MAILIKTWDELRECKSETHELKIEEYSQDRHCDLLEVTFLI